MSEQRRKEGRRRRRSAWPSHRHRNRTTAALRRGRIPLYLEDVGGEDLFCVEPNGAAGPVGFFDCLGFFFSLLLRS